MSVYGSAPTTSWMHQERATLRTKAMAHPRQLGGALMIADGLVLMVSAFMPWFRSRVGEAGTRSISGFSSGKGNAWLFHVPIGWVLLVAGVLLVGAGLGFVAPTRVRWRPVPAAVVAIAGAALLLYTTIDRFHVHAQVHSDLAHAIQVFVQAQPSQSARGQAVIDAARFSDAYGLWMASLAAAAAVALPLWILRRERRAGP